MPISLLSPCLEQYIIYHIAKSCHRPLRSPTWHIVGWSSILLDKTSSLILLVYALVHHLDRLAASTHESTTKATKVYGLIVQLAQHALSQTCHVTFQVCLTRPLLHQTEHTLSQLIDWSCLCAHHGSARLA
jgi:hypothetical protein